MNKIEVADIRKVYDSVSLPDEEIKQMSGHLKEKIKQLLDGRKKREKETGDHFEPRYKMYIVSHRSFVSDFEGYGHGKMSGKRYCFKMDEYKKAILLTIDEVINCIADCANEYCNWRFKILPEDEFLKEYEQYKKKYENELENSHFKYGFKGAHLDINNILNQPKQKKFCEWGYIIRNFCGNYGIFNNPISAIPYYSLYSDRGSYTSAIVDYRLIDEGIEIETLNSIYVIKELKKIDYIDQLKEFDDYKKSKYYDELFTFIKNEESETMKDYMEL